MMWKTARVAALALAMFGSMSFAHNGFAAANAEEQSGSTASGGVVVTNAAIARLKAVLRLSPAQEIHWHTLEATLRHLAQDQTRVADASGSVGFVQRVKARMKSYVLDVSAARQVAAAAQPLIATLDEDQKRDGMMMVRALGVSALF
jgi:zinc resistance-associated protein